MMTVPMDSSAIPSSRELAQRLFKKNIELENGLRRSAQAKIPSDPNVWLQMRENYEAILLEDHEFSDEHEVEFMLWQLHYRRIEEFRLHINAAKSTGLTATQGTRSSSRPDRIKKIRSAFKSFLSESTGFYHDLILKTRAKYGFPLGFFSENHESQMISLKDDKKLVERKKGLLSCHRCLIYLGDLARYKGMYGEGDSAIREFAAASSYYMQAASLCPSSGNPHHQLAILASYSNDDLSTIYRYFRSLAVENPFLTARDNLVIAFEKNRQRAAELISAKTSASNVLPHRSTGSRGKGRGDARNFAKDSVMESAIKESELSAPGILKAFTVQFVRLHGILFTRTSLETFGDYLSSVISDLHELLATGIKEAFNFGADATENALVIVRLMSILIFTAHNMNQNTVDQSYAGILQRSVLLQSTFSASFEFVGHILKRCSELEDVASSFLLPGILVFIEWLACHPDIALGSDVKEKEISARTFFWHQFVAFMNALLSDCHGYIDTYQDETCFSDMSHYDEGETGNRLALWEDFELRGFFPLMQAHLILDFSRTHSIGSDGTNKERKARLQRIFAAGRALMNVIRIGQQGIYFDELLKKFVFGIEPTTFVGDIQNGFADVAELNVFEHASSVESMSGLGRSQSSMIDYAVAPAALHMDSEDEEEEIVFKPTVTEKVFSFIDSIPQTVQPAHVSSVADWDAGIGMLHSSSADSQMSNGMNGSSQLRNSSPIMLNDQALSLNVSTSKWLMEKDAIFLEGLKNINMENDFMHQGGLNTFFSSALAPPASVGTNSFFSNQVNYTDTIIPSPLDSIVLPGPISTALPAKSSVALATVTKKNPVSRPVRHFGPPPGFCNTSSVLQSLPHNLDTADQQVHSDDYSWLDDYQSTSTKNAEISLNHTSGLHHFYSSDYNGAFNGISGFPFLEKQTLIASDAVNTKWHDFQLFEHLKPFADKHIPFTNLKPAMPSMWSGNYFV